MTLVLGFIGLVLIVASLLAAIGLLGCYVLRLRDQINSLTDDFNDHLASHK